MKYSGVDGGTRVLGKVGGLRERAMWRWCGCGAYWVREDGAIDKKWQELLVLLAASYEGAMRGDYVLAERWGKSNPRFGFDLGGGRAIDAE